MLGTMMNKKMITIIIINYADLYDLHSHLMMRMIKMIIIITTINDNHYADQDDLHSHLNSLHFFNGLILVLMVMMIIINMIVMIMIIIINMIVMIIMIILNMIVIMIIIKMICTHISTLSTLIPQAVVASSRTLCNDRHDHHHDHYKIIIKIIIKIIEIIVIIISIIVIIIMIVFMNIIIINFVCIMKMMNFLLSS